MHISKTLTTFCSEKIGSSMQKTVASKHEKLLTGVMAFSIKLKAGSLLVSYLQSCKIISSPVRLSYDLNLLRYQFENLKIILYQ